MRLDKYLADMTGVGRSELKKAIRKGFARVNETVVKDPGFAVREDDEVIFKGERIVYETFVYYMMNKPDGVISATTDPKEKTVLDLMTEVTRKGIAPVGRLDKDTEGLLLLTNDGALNHRLLSPSHHVDKTYYVSVAGELTDEDVRLFAEGLYVDEELTAMPSTLKILDVRPADDDPEIILSEALVTIQEGKFHQIKRMFEAVGKSVLYLKRLSMGTLVLDKDLKPGEYRRLTEEELADLKAI